MEPSDSQITGEPQQIIIDPNTGLPHNVIIIEEPSSGPKIIGICVIIWGVITILGEVLQLGDTLDYGGLLAAVSIVNVLLGAGYIVGGYMIQDYQQRGIHLCLLCLIIGTVVAISMLSLAPEMIEEIAIEEDLSDDEKEKLEANTGLIAGIGIVFLVVCNGICGLILAIPMMITNNGLDKSSLFSGWF